MKKAVILVIILLLFGCGEVPYGTPSESKPEYLPLPERATEQLRDLGVTLPELPFEVTPPLDGKAGKDNPDSILISYEKRRITTDDVIVDVSEIFEVDVETEIRNPQNEYSLFYKFKISNKTDKVFNNVEISICLNPQLEYHYWTMDTFYGRRFDEIVPLGSEIGFPGWRVEFYLDLPSNNPSHLPVPVLKQKFDIFFRDLYIITEWDGGREVYRVNPDDIEFSVNIKDAEDDDTGEDNGKGD